MWGLIFHCKCVFKCQSFSQSTLHLSAKTLTLNASTISNETLWLSGYKHAWAFNEQWKLSESMSTCMSAQTFPLKPLVLIILCVSVFLNWAYTIHPVAVKSNHLLIILIILISYDKTQLHFDLSHKFIYHIIYQ